MGSVPGSRRAPFFIEERLTWEAWVPEVATRHVLAALGDLGVSFGPCHTEYVIDAEHGPRLIEVNDRLIGDHCDFVLGDMLGVDLFELALRISLGERLPPEPPERVSQGHAMVDYVVADAPGVLAASPPAGGQEGAEPGVTALLLADTHYRRSHRAHPRQPGLPRRDQRDWRAGGRRGALRRRDARHGTLGDPAMIAGRELAARTEHELAARVIDTLLREDYAGLSLRVRLRARGTVALHLPAGHGGAGLVLPLERGGFLADLRISRAACPRLALDDVDSALAAISDPMDSAGVASFADECRQALATLELRERCLPGIRAGLAQSLARGSRDMVRGERHARLRSARRRDAPSRLPDLRMQARAQRGRFAALHAGVPAGVRAPLGSGSALPPDDGRLA